MKNKKVCNYKVFFTVMEGDNFVPSNIYYDMTSHVTKSVRFEFLDDAKNFMKNLNEERDFRLVKVKCELEEVSDKV